MYRRVLVAAFAGLSLFFAAAVVLAAPTEIVDAEGRKVVVDAPAKRVVLNFDFEAFTAIAGVEGWPRIVGISRVLWEGWRSAIFNRYTQVIPNLSAMPDVGNTADNNFSAEKVIALKPDVLILAQWAYVAMPTQRAQIEAAGIPIVVIDYTAQTLEKHLASTRAIGKVMGTEARAEELAQLYERQYREVLARVSKAGGSRPKAYVELGQAGAETIGNTYRGSMWGGILTSLGANNIAEGRIPGERSPLNAEAVIAENPDVIFIAGSSWVNRPKAVLTGYDATPEATRRSLAPYAQRPGWADLKAVKMGEIHAIEHGLTGTLFDFVAIQYIAKRLYPEAFRDIDPDAAFRDFHQKYLPVAYSGVWMLPVKP